MNQLESEELLAEIIDRWTEVHKKSMVMLLLLLALTERPMWSKELEQWLLDIAGWDISERGLHRTLKRMNNLGLIEYIEIEAPRTGIKRKDYRVTDFGDKTLKEMRKSSLGYLRNDYFIKSIKNKQ